VRVQKQKEAWLLPFLSFQQETAVKQRLPERLKLQVLKARL